MKLIKKLTPVALATSMALGGLAAPSIASAEMSASIGVANMYLWRGLNLTPDGPQVQGGLEWSNEAGVYGGVWTTNETGGHETDLYLGYGGAAGDFSYDVSYWYYMYPEDVDGVGNFVDLADNALSEFVIGLGYMDFNATFYVSQETQGGSDWVYTTLDYTYGDYNFLFGTWSFDQNGAGDEYSHITVTYSITDDLAFAVSKVSSDDGTTEEDPLFVISYNIPIDMK